MNPRNIIVLIALAATLAACGVRGPLEPPPGASYDPNQPAAIDPLVKPE